MIALSILAAGVLVAGAVAWAGGRIAAALEAGRQEETRARALRILTQFAPGLAAAADDPRALLTWQPVAAAARQAFPDEFALLDRSFGRTFPFSVEAIEAAHAKWSADWLAWERTHDGEYKLKAAQAEQDLAVSGPAVTRARLDAVEREKLESYQRRYGDYVRVSKALQSLTK